VLEAGEVVVGNADELNQRRRSDQPPLFTLVIARRLEQRKLRAGRRGRIQGRRAPSRGCGTCAATRRAAAARSLQATPAIGVLASRGVGRWQ